MEGKQKDEWEKAGYKVPPVMITVTNTTYTSGRIKYSFDKDAFLLSVAGLGELCNPENTLQMTAAFTKAKPKRKKLKLLR